MVQVVERTFYWVSRDSVKFVSLYDTSCICDQTLVLYGERNPRMWCWRCVCGEERAYEGETTHCSLTCSVPVAAQLQPLVPAWQCARVFVCERVSPLCSPVCYSKTEAAASAPNQETRTVRCVHHGTASEHLHRGLVRVTVGLELFFVAEIPSQMWHVVVLL